MLRVKQEHESELSDQDLLERILRHERIDWHRRNITRRLELQKMEPNEMEDVDWIWRSSRGSCMILPMRPIG